MPRLPILPSNIVMVQHIPGKDSYIVFRSGEDAKLYQGSASIANSDIDSYIRECRTSGCFREVAFFVPTGKVSDSTLICKEVLYCKSLGAQGSITKPSGVKPLAFLQSGINWVLWSPQVYTLSVNMGRIGFTKTLRIQTLDMAPDEVKDFMSSCYCDGSYARQREYTRPVNDGHSTHVVRVVEFYFSKTKLPTEFAGTPATDITPENAADLGLHM